MTRRFRGSRRNDYQPFNPFPDLFRSLGPKRNNHEFTSFYEESSRPKEFKSNRRWNKQNADFNADRVIDARFERN